jgi:hypothetical protein
MFFFCLVYSAYNLLARKLVILGHGYDGLEFEFLRIGVLGVKLWSLFFGYGLLFLIGLCKEPVLVHR